MTILSSSKPIRILTHNDTSQTSRFDLFCATVTIPSFQFITLECSCHTHSHTKSLLSIALRGSTYRRVVHREREILLLGGRNKLSQIRLMAARTNSGLVSEKLRSRAYCR